jgi:hypothetical protein
VQTHSQCITVACVARYTLTVSHCECVNVINIMAKNQDKKRSYVHEYFDLVVTDGESPVKKKCTLCTYICTPKRGSTSSMQYHLANSHEIKKPIEGIDTDSGKKRPLFTVASFFASKNRSIEEWQTRQIVLDGLSIRQLAQSEFQEAACLSMRLKHYKSHSTVAENVMNYIEKMKKDTKKKLREKFMEGVRFSAIADEWTSISNRRYLSVSLKSNKETYHLGLVRCKGTITSKVTADLVKVSTLLSVKY